MTNRESQILEWISENPMISQQEIADRANITRSSVAVHISNLMKKGKILGKGYVLQKDLYLCVIGAVNVDITGTSHRSLVDGDSNPGKVSYRFGGVGRNIAENLCLLDQPVEMITVLGDDIYASKLKQHSLDIGIHLNHSLIVSGKNTSTYLCINDEHGEMKLAVSDMDIYEHLTREYLQTKIDFINRSKLVVIDTNLSDDTLDYLFANITVPIFVDAVSTVKAMKLKPYLRFIHTLKPNRIEAELLSGIKIVDEISLMRAAQFFIDAGLKQVFISLGSQGVFYANKALQGKLGNLSGPVINTTGCGDAFMASIVYGFINELDIISAAKLGLAGASICARSEEAVNRDLNIDFLYEVGNIKTLKEETK